MNQSRVQFIAAANICAVLFPFTVVAADWTHWRGESRNGIVDEHSGFKSGKWNAGKELWKKNVGRGSTSPLVIGNRVYTMGWNSGRDTVYCFDARSGRELWKQSYASPGYGRKSLGDKGLYCKDRNGNLKCLPVNGS